MNVYTDPASDCTPTLPALNSERLTLCPWQENDLDVIHNIFIDAGVRRYLWDGIVVARERTRGVLNSHFSSVASSRIGYWGVFLKRDTAMIGFCGFRFIHNTPQIELMYGLLPAHWGRGLATEASRIALDYAWRNTEFARIWARTDPPNLKSVEVMRRLEMRHVESTDKMITYVIERPQNRILPGLQSSIK